MKFITGKSAKIPFVHRAQDTPDFGGAYGQDIEPSGMYVSKLEKRHWPSERPGGEGWQRAVLKQDRSLKRVDYGWVRARNPLVLESGGAVDWKRELSEMYDGATGKKLSRMVQRDSLMPDRF